ncbi:reverse transcriptase domain-containing protein [Tanacetum coccineum]
MEIKIDEWVKSKNISSEQTEKTDPPPPQVHTEHVNVVFTGSGKFVDSLKIQTLPLIIVEDKPIKTSKKGYHVIESHKSSTEHPIFNEFIIINISEEDVEPELNLPLQEIIIFDLDDQPMWENAKIVAPTPNSAIVQPNVDENLVINSTHLKIISENKFDGIQRADPHDHIREFLAICNMFRYGETHSKAVKLLIFPFSLCDEAITWFNELNEESITSWEQMRKAFINRFFPPSLFNRLLLEIKNFSQNICESLTEAWLRLKNMLLKCHGHGLTKGVIIQIFYYGLDEPTLAILDVTAGGIFLYKSPNQAFQILEDKAMDSKIIILNEELQDMREKYNKLREGNASKNDDTPMSERRKENYIQSEGYQNQNSQDSFSHQSLHDPNDSEKSLTKLNNDVRNDLEDFKRRIRSMRTVHWKLYDSNDRKTTGVLPNKKSKTINQEPQNKIDLEKSMTKFLDDQRVSNIFIKNNLNDMILKMKQNEKDFQTKIKNMERKIDEWSKSQTVSSEQPDRTDPPPPQAHNEQVNVVFTGSGKSDDSSKIQTLPPIIVNNKTKKDKPIKTSKRDYQVVKTNEYPFREYIPKIPYPQRLNMDHSHLNRIVKVS